MEKRKAPSQPEPRFTRAFGHKVRTGCVTCKRRHKKCDEQKPTCRRCQDEGFVCDGYPHLAVPTPSRTACARPGGSLTSGSSTPGSSTPGSSSSSSSGSWTPPPTPPTESQESALATALAFCLRYPDWDDPLFGTAKEKLFFYHFHQATAKYLAESPGPGDFWADYVLPLAHQSEPVRLAVAAVGAAHQLFVHGFPDPSAAFRSGSRGALILSPDATVLDRLKVDMVGLYNRSIRALTRDQARWNESTRDLETLLVCCLLFVCFESMTGRYSESIKHLRAGIVLLTSGRLVSRAPGLEVEKQILDLFARVGVEFSQFTNDSVVPPPQTVQEEMAAVAVAKACATPQSDSFTGSPAGAAEEMAGPQVPPEPFTDLREAAFLMRQLDVDSVHAWSRPDCDEEEIDMSFVAIVERFWQWNSRFECTLVASRSGAIPPLDEARLLRLDLQRHVWLVMLSDEGRYCCCSRCCEEGGQPCQESLANKDKLDADVEAACREYMARARLMVDRLGLGGAGAAPPTFSLDGDLVSSLAFIINVAPRGLAEEALALMRTINRREGVWDSRELTEFYEAVVASGHDPNQIDLHDTGGIPAMIKSLSLAPYVSANSGIMKMVAELALEDRKEVAG